MPPPCAWHCVRHWGTRVNKREEIPAFVKLSKHSRINEAVIYKVIYVTRK